MKEFFLFVLSLASTHFFLGPIWLCNGTVKLADNAFLSVTISVQYRVNPDKANDAYYKLAKPDEQIRSYVVNQVRALASSSSFDALFRSRNLLEQGVKQVLVDILPVLLSQRERPWAIGPLSNGNSYGVLQDIHLEESLRWVPASSEMHALPLRAWHG